MKRGIGRFVPADVFRSLAVALKYTLRGAGETRVSGNGAGRPDLVRVSDGGDLCTGCRLCEKVCPSKAVRLKVVRKDGKWKTAVFGIDAGRCVSCALCVKACPVSALSMRNVPVCPVQKMPDVFFLKNTEDGTDVRY